MFFTRLVISSILSAGILFCASVQAGEIAQGGLVLHLDAQEQAKAGAAGNAVWKNLAAQTPGRLGDAALHHFSASNWTGTGAAGFPYALRFDGETTYAEGEGSLELPELTMEIWANVEGMSGQHGKRGATLIGNDFGKGGTSLLIQATALNPIVLNGTDFNPIPASVPVGCWQQIVVTLSDKTARLYINGKTTGAREMARAPQKEHRNAWQLGCARFPEMDFAATDSLIGSIAIVRVYNRVLTPGEVAGNFQADSPRFDSLIDTVAMQPLKASPPPSVPGLGAAAPVRAMKWDYYYEPVRAAGNKAPEGVFWSSNRAFDGYPTNIKEAYPPYTWSNELPKPGAPATMTIAYPRPVAVTKFVHYFSEARPTSAWKEVVIYISDDQAEWKPIQSFKNLAPDAPQVLGIDQPVVSSFYKIEISALAEGAAGIVTHEIETWYGSTIGNVDMDTTVGVQSEPCSLRVHVASLDAALKDATLRLVAPEGSILGETQAAVPLTGTDGASIAEFKITPANAGLTPMTIELRVGDFLIDKRPFTLRSRPKLEFRSLSTDGAIVAKKGDSLLLKGMVANSGSTIAEAVKVSWLGKNVNLGDVAPGHDSAFEIAGKAAGGFDEGALTAEAKDGAQTKIHRAVICPASKSNDITNTSASLNATYKPDGDSLRMFFTIKGSGNAPTSATLRLFANTQACPLIVTQSKADKKPVLAAAIQGGTVLVDSGFSSATSDPQLKCIVIPNNPNALEVSWADLEFRLAVEKPKVMFRPHIDWYTVEHGANWAPLQNAHHSATRMLCIQTDQATVSMVPDTDNINWGFTPDNQMIAQFAIPLMPASSVTPGRFRPITEAPSEFNLLLPVRKGDWWDAYQHVVTDVFKFEQPRQWAMPITQMQMLTSRALMRYEAWSERWQIVKCLSNDSWFWTFYGTAYTVPALYSWYLATDDIAAKAKAEKMVAWLIKNQYRKAPMEGAWFSSYFANGDSPEMVGGDFIRNPWLISHATGAAVKTLLWYYEASGRKDSQALAAAQGGCDWMLKNMRPNGGWPYAFDLQGNAITEACGAGQIWNTWALWRMYKITGDEKLKDAAIKSKEFFQKTYMNEHRYVGYWEDTVAITKDNKSIRSWEAYEPAVAVLAFSEMGDKALAMEAAKDAATWSWTRVTSVRQYETGYGQTTEQAICGPSQAQSPMVGLAFHEIYEQTGKTLWSDFAGATKAINFGADPEQGYGMVATSGWNIANASVVGPPFENTRPSATPNMARGDYGRELWTGWCTDQFAWLALEWLVREANLRAPQYVTIDPEKLRGTVLGEAGRVKMPEEKCDVNSYEHMDINWVGYQNDLKYALLIMNHKEKVSVAVRPHEAHLDVYTRSPRILVGSGKNWEEVEVKKRGIQYEIDIPEKGNALLIWDRIK